ncbi:hypothetical protein IFM89_038088 [Coptis chinensis]|uniref:Uncharacterized protein n=1 Tax=Coptis chinensis TaxID=261450 RepID=A0A835HB39_9MAGN|nr:hypothetical protein IFM89_038088 [Coptis chinensis]
MEELWRLVNGVRLIAKEIAKHRQLQQLVSATDLAGLTKGKLIEFSNITRPIQEPTLVHFKDPPPHIQEEMETITPVDHTLKHTNNVVTIPQEVELPKRRKPRERRVPSTPFSRALGFAGLGAGLAWGTIQESARRIVYGNGNSDSQHKSHVLSEQNAQRLASTFCRMRGAALKVGQLLSIQDESLIPAPASVQSDVGVLVAQFILELLCAYLVGCLLIQFSPSSYCNHSL